MAKDWLAALVILFKVMDLNGRRLPRTPTPCKKMERIGTHRGIGANARYDDDAKNNERNGTRIKDTGIIRHMGNHDDGHESLYAHAWNTPTIL